VAIKVKAMNHSISIFFISSPLEQTLGARQNEHIYSFAFGLKLAAFAKMLQLALIESKAEIVHLNDKARGVPGRKVDNF
jgi:hypothetical protein